MSNTPVNNPADSATTVTVIEACGRAQVPVLLWSEPGVGKSSLIKGLAAAKGVACEVVYGSIREPADVAGLPVVTDNGTVLHEPRWAKNLIAAGEGILDLAELSTCTPEMQAAMLGVMLDKQVGDVTLPRDVWIVADANPVDCAAGGWDLAAPTANRVCHIDYQSSLDDWLTGMTTGWRTPHQSRALGEPTEARRTLKTAEVVGFIQSKGMGALHQMPTDADASGNAWPSRRTWKMLADTLPYLADDDHAAIQAVTYGLVGQGIGIEFLSWRRNADLPDPRDLIAKPDSFDWTGRPDRVWAALNAVVGYAAAEGTATTWQAAWGPLVAAAKSGAADVAGAAARQMDAHRPLKAKLPKTVAAYRPLLEAAGLAA